VKKVGDSALQQLGLTLKADIANVDVETLCCYRKNIWGISRLRPLLTFKDFGGKNNLSFLIMYRLI
jgi:hypothetical protein